MKNMFFVFSCENLINIVPEIAMYPPPKRACVQADNNSIITSLKDDSIRNSPIITRRNLSITIVLVCKEVVNDYSE